MSSGTFPPTSSLCHSSQPDGRGEAQDATFLCPFNFYVELPSPYILQEVQVGIINSTMCNHLYKKPAFRYNIWGDMVCAGDVQGGKDACFVSVPPHPNQALLGPSFLPSQPQAGEPLVSLCFISNESFGSHGNPWGVRYYCLTLQMQKLRLDCL